MAINAQQQQNIIALTVGMFSAAPGARNLSDFAANFEFNNGSYVALADALINTGAYQSQYAGIVTLEGRIDKALANLGIDQDSDGYEIAQAHFAARAEQGFSEAEILVEAIEYLLGDNADEAFADVQEQLANRVEVATYFSVEKQRSSDSLEDLKSVVANVTSDDATVETAKQIIDDGGFDAGQQGQTFTLTAAVDGSGGVDNLVGTAGNDTFRALAEGSLDSSDIIDGGAGRDTLNISDGAIATTEDSTAAPIIRSVEVINNRHATTLDLNDVSGAQRINSIGTEAVTVATAFTYENASASTVFAANNLQGVVASGEDEGDSLNTINVSYSDDDSNDTANLAVNNSAVNFNLGDSNNIENVVVNVTGNSNTITLTDNDGTDNDDGNDNVETVTITGSGNLNVAFGEDLDNLETFDASAATGNITATFGIAGEGSEDDSEITVTGGAGNDLLASNFDNATLIGGAGNDILGGGGSNLTMTGGEGRDEFHFSTLNENSTITDFTAGEDVISLLQDADGNGLAFANSTNSGINGASDLNAADFSKFASFANLDAAAANGQVVVFTEAFEDQDAIETASNASTNASGTGEGVNAEFFFMAYNEEAGNGQLYYTDGDGTTNLVADVEGVDLAGVQALTAANFDVYV
ncbi:hypothetical protein RN347_05945 [Halomonas sp. PAMB 3264]|uniref:hypothetical protein n=1 Tax=Halomonas sp. PAMB 3264 TaxID=3075222 RepID=UPI00289F6E10|nr:hypothetical protein [Halomonas sp. PAMB 3264]WNL43443.1 hypothetical protein RN347_05945 [Halomonas sp. PAMB 3264]